NAVIAALKRCATQNRKQNRVFPQPVKPNSKPCTYRSGGPLRHPKSSATPTFSASCEAVPYPKPFMRPVLGLRLLLAEQVLHWRGGGRALWRCRSRTLHRRRRPTGIWHTAFRSRRFFRLQKFSGIEQRPPQRRIVAGPRAFEFGLALEVSAHCLHLGIQIVKIVQHERFGKHRQLRRSEFVLPVIADDQMF